MDSLPFDDLIRTLAGSRRSLFAGGLAGAAGWLGLADTDARTKRKRRRKHRPKPKPRPIPAPNAYGCLDVGDPCNGADQCCSGICGGKKGRKTCRAHGTGTCAQDAPGSCEAANPVLCNDDACLCQSTTAGSTFCATLAAPSACAECRTDADCEAQGFPTGSACAPYAEGTCAGACESGMACLAPCGLGSPDLAA